MTVPEIVTATIQQYQAKMAQYEDLRSYIARLRTDAAEAVSACDWLTVGRLDAEAAALEKRLPTLLPQAAEEAPARQALQQAVLAHFEAARQDLPTRADLPWCYAPLVAQIRRTDLAWTPRLTADEQLAEELVDLLAHRVADWRHSYEQWAGREQALPAWVDAGGALCDELDSIVGDVPEVQEAVDRALSARHVGGLSDAVLALHGWAWQGTALHGRWARGSLPSSSAPATAAPQPARVGATGRLPAGLPTPRH